MAGRMKYRIMQVGRFVKKQAMKKEPGIDGILVTVGLCIIALLLCVVMKDSLTTFIKTLVDAMTTKAQQILTGVSA
ncbi:MAG: hypothetical protein K2K63_05305 [Acetatifactor sp.]|nr:hypothetical protein [Acetatifactor sp.]